MRAMRKYVLGVCAVLAVPELPAAVVSEDDPEAEIAKHTEEELLSRVFGKRRRRKDIMMEFDINLDGENIGRALVIVGKENRIFAKHLREILEKYLLPEEVEKIGRIEDKSGFAEFRKLNSAGIKTKIDLQTLNIEISVPIDRKKVRRLGGFREEDTPKPNVAPAMFSAVLGSRISHTFDHDKISSGNRTDIVLTPSVNAAGIVLEGEWTFDKYSDRGSKFYREYSSLIYDFPHDDMRICAGDVFGGSRGYYSVPRLWGVGFRKNAKSSSISGYRESLQITVLRESKVEIYVNGALLRTMEHVAPGTYYADDIPYSQGSNDVQIKLIDNTGRTEVIDAAGFFDSSVISAGQFAVDISAGSPEKYGHKGGRYDGHNKAAAGSVRCGLPWATDIAAGGIRSKIGHTYAFQLRNSNALGFFKGEYGISKYKEVPAGRACKISYSSPSFNLFEETSLSFSTSYEKTDSFFFSYLDDSSADQDPQRDLLLTRKKNYNGKNTASVHRVYLNNVFTVNFSFNYEIRRHQFSENEKYQSLSLSKNINLDSDVFRSFNVYFSYGKMDGISGKSYKNYSLSCSLNFQDEGILSSGYNKSDCGGEQYVSYSSSCLDNTLYYNIQGSRRRDYSSAYGSAAYYHQRFKADVSYNRSTDSSYSARVGFDTNLYFAGGSFGVSKNSAHDGGFVIVSPDGELKDQPIKIGGSGIESGVLGGAVITTPHHSYASNEVDVKNLPDNIEIKDTSIVNYGEYKRGGERKISIGGAYLAKGILVDKQGKPFAMAAGFAVHVGDKDAEPVSFFSNSSGKFVLSNLKLGRYRVSINVEGCEDFYIEIRPCKDNIADLGRIKCEGTYEDI